MPNIFWELLTSKDRHAIVAREKQLNKRRFQQLFNIKPNWASKRYVVDEWEGLTVLLDKRSDVDICVHNKGEWETPQREMISNRIAGLENKADCVFLDIGAYWGMYGLLAHQQGIGEVHFFEPDPSNRNQLQAQLFLNGLDREITLWPYAISDSDGQVHFRKSEAVEDGNRGGSRVVEAGEAAAITIECRVLDKLLPLRGRTIIAKIDVEGHEEQVLRGMRDVIAQNDVFFQVEVFDDAIPRVRKLAEELGLRFLHRIDIDDYYESA